MNQTRKDIVIHSVIAAAGLFCCGIGIYFTLQANIGVSPWDVFHQGISSHTGMLCAWLGFLPQQTSLPMGILCMMAGLTITACGMRIYMGCALGCGPRDTLMVALCKRTGLPVGPVTMMIYAVVTAIGWFLGGQVGIGTVLSVLYVGPALQTICRLTGFDAAKVTHQNLLETLRILSGKRAFC